MNRLLLEPSGLVGDRAWVTDARRLAHLRTVLRVSVGQALRAGILGGPTGVAEVHSITDTAIEMRFTAEAAAPHRPAAHTLVVAIPRPKVLARILRLVSELGVAHLHLCRSWRVDPSYLTTPLLGPAMREQLIIGAEQGGFPHLPKVSVYPRFMEMIAGDPGRDTTRLLMHPYVGAPVENAYRTGPATLAIGPEGGWVEREIETLLRQGYACVQLGPQIMRVETAVVASLSQVAMLGRLSASAADSAMVDDGRYPIRHGTDES